MSGNAICAAAALALALAASCAPHRATSPALPRDPTVAAPPGTDVASYRIAAHLHGDHRTIDAAARIRWRNTSATPARELWWHLYANAFADGASEFMARGGAAAYGSPDARTRGWMHVRALRDAASGADLLAAARRDPRFPRDATQLVTPLDRVVPPGGTLEVEVRWRTVLPAPFMRSGAWEGFAFAAQWFPKLAVRERDGRWAHAPYHPFGEFYADFGTYDLDLVAPAGDVVGASGVAVAAAEAAPGGTRHRFRAEHAHDVAFTSWAHFGEQRARVGGVLVRALHGPGDGRVAARQLAALGVAIPALARRLGPYPYPQLTVVVPPRAAAGVGGMEYPTLITTGGYWFAPRAVHDAEYVALHEFAHQYFHTLVASDERSWPFLDEGLTEFATGVLLTDVYGAGGALARTPFGTLGIHAVHSAAGPRGAPLPPIASAVERFGGSDAYAAQVYRRAASVLETLARTYGHGRVFAALRAYVAAQRFRHATPADLLAAFEAEFGPAIVARFLRPALATEARLDLAVLGVSARATGPGRYVSEVRLGRDGPLSVPVDVELEDARGRRWRRAWDGTASIATIVHTGDAPVRAAWVDPDRRVLLDRDRLDNARASAVRAGAPVGLVARLAAWLGAAMRVVGP